MMSFFRFFRIIRTMFTYGLDELVFKRFPPSRILCVLPHFKKRFQKTISQRILESFITLGPVFVKLGQVLSTRPDFCNPDLVLALSELQDQVPPFETEHAKKIIEQEFNKPLNQVFKSFEDTPLASASVAQVHAGTLMDGTSVAIKIIRPNVEKQIKKDIRLMYILTRIISLFFRERHRFRLQELVKEFETTIYLELDLLREAANASQIKRNTEAHAQTVIPTVFWSFCTKKVMTTERIHGISIDETKALKKAGVSLEDLAKQVISLFFTHVFHQRFFHADMHPGNIFIDSSTPHHPKIMLVDFGIMGSLSEEDQYYLAQNFLAFFHHDYDQVAKLHIESGWVSASTRVDQFSSAIRSVCEPILSLPPNEVSLGMTLLRLFDVGRRFELIVQPQLMMMQKTLLNIEGLCKTLNPSLNIWKTAEPILLEWSKKQHGWQAIKHQACDQWSKWIHQYPDIPFYLLKKLKEPSENKPIQSQKSSTGALLTLIALSTMLGYLCANLHVF